MAWTRASYDALYNWIDNGKRDQVRQVLKADDLDDVITRLDNADNMGIWYQITKEAADAVGNKIVEASAHQAERELDQLSRITN